MSRLLIIVFFSIGLVNLAVAQINLTNPSFEDKPQDATKPTGWHSCKQGSTPDILPGFWNVHNESSDGDTYIGLITRDDGSWESIGQRLRTGIPKGKCYSFQIDLAHSKTYEGYNLPVRIRVWGGTTRCSKTQLIGEVDGVNSLDWVTHDFQFYATHKINYIILEAYYVKGMMIPYKGNVLIDNITEMKPCIRAYEPVLVEPVFPRG